MQELQSLDLGNNVLRFDVIKGVIAGDKKWAETHVYSTGGSGYVGSQGGYVQLPTVQSNVSTRHEIWVKEHGSEREFPISLTDTNVKVREGHEVAIVVADTGQHRYFAQLVNCTAQQAYPLLSNFHTFVLEASKLRPVDFLRAAILVVVLATVIGTAANIAYQSSQQTIEERNRLNNQPWFDGKYIHQHQVKLLGVSEEQYKQMSISGEAKKLLDKKTFEKFGVVIPFGYFSMPPELKKPKLSPKQENAIHQFLYGYPYIAYQKDTDYDKEYHEHGSQIGLLVGAALGFVGLFLASYRVNRFTRRLNEAKAKVQAHFAQLANALK